MLESSISQNIIKKTTQYIPNITKNIDTVTSDTVQNVVILPQQEKINVFNSTVYSNSPNAVKLLSSITNNKGKVRLYTDVNSNIKVGDKVFIMYNIYGSSYAADGIIMDNYLEFSGCTDIYLPQLQGYNVLEIGGNNNEITIDRYYDSRFVNKKIYDHYIGEIYVKNIKITGGEIDGAEILNSEFNTGVDTLIDINLVQSVVFSGLSFYVRSKDKYDNLYITTNSSTNTGGTASVYKPYIYKGADTLNQDPTPVSSYYTNNNNSYGYNYIHNNHLYNCQIDNGYYENCVLNNCIINGGLFLNCNIFESTINGGIFNNTILSPSCYWFYGTWSGGTFAMDVWYDGIWNGGDFIGKDWRNGVFNDGILSGSTWRTGLFQGGSMRNCIWNDGTFSGGEIINSKWIIGTFNSGFMNLCTWGDGICNGGKLLNVVWNSGVCNGGNLYGVEWINGIFNDGSIIDSYWNDGIFNGGTFNSNNNIPNISNGTLEYGVSPYNPDKYWKTGTFNGGTFSNSVWSGGTFYDGTFNDGSLWLDGDFIYGDFNNSSWVNGNLRNGKVTSSYFYNVNWKRGIWNSGTLGVMLDGIGPTINWYGGTFNKGIFGCESSTFVNWYGGDFYGGDFYNGLDCNTDTYGGFYGGTFHNGNFHGVFWLGVWVNGNFTGCNKSGILTDRTTNTIPTNNNFTRKFGESSLKNPQQNLRNL